MSVLVANDAELCVTRAEALLGQRGLSAALVEFDRAEMMGAAADRCSAGRWMAYMLQGEYELAWRESDAIRARGGHDPHRFWMGEDLRGRRVMVRSLHGFGDAAQMLRYAPRVRELAAKVMWEVAPELVELARCFEGVEDVLTWGEGAPARAPEWDVQVEVMELPYLFRTTLEDLPGAAQYVHVPSSILGATTKIMGARVRPRVGLCSAASDWDTCRSLHATDLDTFLASGDVEFWCMDRTGGVRGDPRLRNVRDECGDGLLKLASAIANLDLVITVDTLAAHLAGAMGKPAWVMLQYAADWRWMVDRSDSAWYPSLKLFRQSRPGDWSDVVAAVSTELKAWVRQGGSTAL